MAYEDIMVARIFTRVYENTGKIFVRGTHLGIIK